MTNYITVQPVNNYCWTFWSIEVPAETKIRSISPKDSRWKKLCTPTTIKTYKHWIIMISKDTNLGSFISWNQKNNKFEKLSFYFGREDIIPLSKTQKKSIRLTLTALIDEFPTWYECPTNENSLRIRTLIALINRGKLPEGISDKYTLQLLANINHFFEANYFE